MIEHYINATNQYLMTHPYLGELFAFVVAFAESLPLIGTIVPGSITMTVIGILVGRGIVPGASTLFFATVGALAGDTIGFWIGKYYDHQLRNLWPFKKNPQWLIKGEAFFEKHGGKSIVIGRFVGPVRSSVPLIAGLLKLSWGRFFLASIPSAFLWAVAYLVPGIVIGAISLELAPSETTKFVLIGLAIIIFLWLIFWAIQRFFVFLVMTINRWIDKLWFWLSRRPSLKYLIRIITNHHNPNDHRQLMLFILAILSLAGFVILLSNVVHTGILTEMNKPIFYFFQSVRTIHFDYFFAIFTLLGKYIVVYTGALLIAVGLLWKKQWRSCAHLLALVIITGLVIYFFKGIFYSPRPTGFAVIDTSSSFPSGHTLLSVSIFGLIAFLVTQQLQQKWHWIPYTVTGLIVAIIALSRIYLGAHWLTDVIGSVLLGLTLLLSVIISYRRYPPKPFATFFCYFFLALTILIPWGIYTGIKIKSTLHRYEPSQPIQYVNVENWWNNPTQYLPIYRLNRFGKPIQPFNLQWTDDLQAIKQNLLQSGWVLIHNETKVQTTLNRFSSQDPEKHLPVFPLLYRHKPPVLFMIKHITKQSTIIELRLWTTNIIFKDSPLPVWIGSVDYHMAARRHHLTLKKSELISLTDSGGIDEVIKNLQPYQWKQIQVNTSIEPKKVSPLHWNGMILLVRSQ